MGDKYPKKTYVISSAQGIQNPYSAKMYGADASKGAPNVPLIQNMESYAAYNDAELQIHSIVGANVNEIELDPFFHNRYDVYIEKDSQTRNLQNREKEKSKREKYESKKEKWLGKEESKKEEQRKKEIQEQEKQYKKEHEGDLEGFAAEENTSTIYPIKPEDCPYNMPMHYFWETIPETNFPLTGTKRLNENIEVFGLPIKPQNKYPLTAKGFLTKNHGGTSIILPSPKRMMKSVPQGEAGQYPHILITTGCCTHPNYNLGDMGFIAKMQHSYGFVAVDILNDKIHLTRIVPAFKNGTFVDLGIKYTPPSVGETMGQRVKEDVLALVLGDSHFAEIHPKVDLANKEMMQYLQPRCTHFNDVFDALSINIHESNDPIRRFRKSKLGINNLEKELILTGNYLIENANLAQRWGGEIVVNFSNHDDMLYRWLSQELFRKDDENRLTAYKILAQDIDRNNAFETAVKLFCNIPNNVTFLKPGDDRKYQGYLCSPHGHLGSNGARGSLKNLEDAYGKVIIGHSHQLEVSRDAISVGTSTIIPLEYQLGRPSTSMAGNAVVYDCGLVQAIPIIKGMWAKEEVLEFLKQ